MTGPNQPNGHHSFHSAHLPSEVQLETNNSERNPLCETEQSYNAKETFSTTSQLNEGSAFVPTITNLHSEVEERGPSYIPVSSDISLLESSSVPSTPLENQSISPQTSNCREIKDADGVSISGSPDHPSANEKETDATVPAVPPHGNSPDKSEEIVAAEIANLITSGAAQNSSVVSPAEQPGSSNGFGAAPKPKAGKPRSRNRHKR